MNMEIAILVKNGQQCNYINGGVSLQMCYVVR